MRVNARALTGMMIGTTIMFLFGAVWLLLGIFAGRHSPAWVRISVVLAGLLIALWIGLIGKDVLRLSHAAPQPTMAEKAMGEQIGRRFGWVSGLEGGAIVAAIILMNVIHRPHAIAPAIALIVGLHFFPLAGVFSAPFYYFTGAVGSAIGIAGFFIPDVPLRLSFIGLAFGLLLWITSVVRLVQASRLINA